LHDDDDGSGQFLHGNAHAAAARGRSREVQHAQHCPWGMRHMVSWAEGCAVTVGRCQVCGGV